MYVRFCIKIYPKYNYNIRHLCQKNQKDINKTNIYDAQNSSDHKFEQTSESKSNTYLDKLKNIKDTIKDIDVKNSVTYLHNNVNDVKNSVSDKIITAKIHISTLSEIPSISSISKATSSTITSITKNISNNLSDNLTKNVIKNITDDIKATVPLISNDNNIRPYSSEYKVPFFQKNNPLSECMKLILPTNAISKIGYHIKTIKILGYVMIAIIIMLGTIWGLDKITDICIKIKELQK